MKKKINLKVDSNFIEPVPERMSKEHKKKVDETNEIWGGKKGDENVKW